MFYKEEPEGPLAAAVNGGLERECVGPTARVHHELGSLNWPS